MMERSTMRNVMISVGIAVAAVFAVGGLSVGSIATAEQAPPKPGGTLLQCGDARIVSGKYDHAADGWTEKRTPEQLSAGVWAAEGNAVKANVAGGVRVHDARDAVQLAYRSHDGRVVAVHTFSRGMGGWKLDETHACAAGAQ